MMEIKAVLISSLLMLPIHAQSEQALLSGVQKNYHVNGQVQLEQQYKNNKQDGYVREYYPNGKLAFVQGMKDGKINGDVKAYYESGNLKGQVRYIDNVQDGISKEYYLNGQIKEEVVYIDGQMMSLRQFDENGKLTFSQTGKFDYGCAVVK